MEETKALAQHQLLLQHHHHQQQQQQLQQVAHQTQQQQFMILQHLQQQQQQKQLAQASSISRFPSNIDAHLRVLRPPINLQHKPNTSPNPNPTPDPSSNLKLNSVPNLHQQNARAGQQLAQQSPTQQLAQQSPTQQQQQSRPQQKAMRPVNHLELQMAYQDAWRVCNPDFKRPFSSLEDACERLLPYHVVADYEAEEDERILDSDTTGQMSSRSQQWDHNIAAKVAEFTATFEKQALAFNIIYSKRVEGEFRSEERMMIEQALCHEAKRSYLEVKTELELRGRASLEAKIRMTARAQAELTHAESQSHAERLVRGPIRASALGSQGNDISTGEQEHGVNPYEMMNGCGNNIPRDGREPSEDFLNDDENENADTRVQEGWRGVGEFDLNTR